MDFAFKRKTSGEMLGLFFEAHVCVCILFLFSEQAKKYALI